MNYISMCSGIEAASAAYVPLGWIPVAFSEIEPFPCKVLKHHHPSVPNHGDFTAFDWSIYRGAIDLLVAGTPCQAFSVAGLRNSLADARGNLTLEFIRAADAIQPRFIIWENVPGVLSTSDNAFGCFLAGIVGCDEPIVAEQGWPNAGVVHGPKRAACWRVLDAQYFGLAQRRKRVFVVACPRNEADPAEVLFEWESLRRDSPPSREARQGIAGGFEIGPSGGSATDLAPTIDSRAKDGPIRNQLAPCALDVLERGGMGRIDAESETMIIAHPLLAKGNDSHAADLDTYVAHSLRGEGHDASEDGTGRGTPLVPIAFQSNAGAYLNSAINVTPTLRIGGDGGNTMAIAFTIHGTDKTQKIASETETAGSLRTKPPGSQENSSTTVAVSSMAVRRLTPRECERLQGFPDDYTLIPNLRQRKNPKPHESRVGFGGGDIADGPRYKALGNSMAVPVMRWIGRRIMEAAA